MIKKPTYQELEGKIEKLKKKLSENEANSKQLEINEKRLKSLWKIAAMQANDFKEICDTVLEEIVIMTESQYGFYGFVKNNEKEFTLYSWSESVMDDCAVQTKPIHFEIEKSGVWGNAVRKRKPLICNNYASESENKKGMPEGHVAIDKILSVPVISVEDKILALGCVANKQENYNSEDVTQLTTYLNSAQLILEKGVALILCRLNISNKFRFICRFRPKIMFTKIKR